MAKRRKKSNKIGFNVHKFITLGVLVLAVVGIGATVLASQQRTNTESEATGGNYGSVNNCKKIHGYAGGIQLYNKINKKGGYRVMCVPNVLAPFPKTYHDHLGKDEGGGLLVNIWRFNNKTDSFKLRVNKGCKITATLYDGKYSDSKVLGRISAGSRYTNKTLTKFKNLSRGNSNRATSLVFKVECGSGWG